MYAYKLSVSIIAAALLTLGATHAGAAQLSSQDKNFVRHAAQGNMAEVNAGQLAQQKAGDAQVKQFGQTLMNDHGQANQELQQLAQQQNLTLPKQPSRSQKAEMKKLQAMSGSAFDKSFVQEEIQDHQKDIAEFQKEAQSGKNQALKDYAQKNLPVLQKHLQMAQSLQGQG